MNTPATSAPLPAAHLAVILGPAIIVAAITAALALLAALLGWHREATLPIAAGAGLAAAVPALMLLLRQRADRQETQRELHSVQARVGSIVESAMDAIITVDESQRIVLFNAAAEAVFGYARADAIGAPLESFIPQRFRGGHAAHVHRFGDTGASSRRMGA